MLVYLDCRLGVNDFFEKNYKKKYGGLFPSLIYR